MDGPDLAKYASKATTKELYKLQSKFSKKSQSEKVKQIEIELFKRPEHRKNEFMLVVMTWISTFIGFVLAIYYLFQDEVVLKGAIFSIEDDLFLYWLGIIFLFGFSIFFLWLAIDSSHAYKKYKKLADQSA